MSKIKKSKFKLRQKLTFIALGLLLLILLFESMSFAVLTSRSGEILFAKTYFTKKFAQTESNGCMWKNTVQLHPYYGYSYHTGQECSSQNTNLTGFKGKAIEPQNNPEYFDILVLGGSVAELFASTNEVGLNGFESYLNQNYNSPNQKPFRILNGAIAAGQHPMQLIIANLYHFAVDAVISIEGFNELNAFKHQQNFYQPPFIFTQLKSKSTGAVLATYVLPLIEKSFRWASSNMILSRSYTLFFVGSSFIRYLNKSASEDLLPQFNWLNPNQDFRGSWDRNMSLYKHSLTSLSNSLGPKSEYFSIFIQPVPAVYKPLSEEEKLVVGQLDYKDQFLRLETEILGLKAENLKVHSLIQLLKNSPETLYVDHIHFKGSGAHGGKAYDLMYKAMANHLESDWNLSKKQ